ncbi:MAG TPA: hypothetical protein VF790_02465, partial [Dissulfurispiraceae bacterium]
MQEQLIEQFKSSHEVIQREGILENVEAKGTLLNDNGLLRMNRREIITPILSFDAGELEEKAIALQKWEGVVTEIGKDVFNARLFDLTANNPEEIAEFSIDDVSEDDRELLKPGAIFYWSIGYLTTRTGQRMRMSFIKFRRLPAWTERDIKSAKKRAAEL